MGPAEPHEIAHGDIEGGHRRPGTGYFNGLLYGWYGQKMAKDGRCRGILRE
jgi:hypothetical protein